MTAERDMAGFVIPFTIGAALASAFQQADIHTSIHMTGATFLAAASCLSVLSYGIRNQLKTSILLTTIVLSGICCGILCGELGSSHFRLPVPGNGPVFRIAQNFGQNMKAVLADIPFADGRTNAIATALITGDRSWLTSEDIEIFRKSGASHILALSGMHLGIIYGLLKALFAGFGGSQSARRLKSCLNILVCGFYTLSTGSGPSIVRAFIFIALTETAHLSGRRTNLKCTLFAALLIQLILTPQDITNVGFQLSYAAMAGIAFIFPWLKNFWPEAGKGWTGKVLKRVWDSAALSIACQITTAPIAFVYFGTFPEYFLLTNLLSVPIIGITIPAILFTSLLSCCGICPELFVKVTESLMNTLIQSLSVISSL